MTLRVLIDIGHPAHVHFLKHIAWRIQSLGGEVCITTREKDVATRLLDAYGFDYHLVGRYSNLIDKALSLISTNYKILKIARDFNPHAFVSLGSIHATHVASFMGRICLCFEDTEDSGFQHALYVPLATRVYTPQAFRKHLGKNQVIYQGYHEMAYLLPKYFQPDPTVLSKYGLKEDEVFSIVRVVAWKATHDWRQSGISDLRSLVNLLERYGRVFITSESNLEPDLDENRVKINPEEMHTMLAYAKVYVGEGITMASESATLGTPAILLSTRNLGVPNSLADVGLICHIKPSTRMRDEILLKLEEILETPREIYREKSLQFLKGKVDVIDFAIQEMLALARKKYM